MIKPADPNVSNTSEKSGTTSSSASSVDNAGKMPLVATNIPKAKKYTIIKAIYPTTPTTRNEPSVGQKYVFIGLQEPIGVKSTSLTVKAADGAKRIAP